MKGEEPGFIPWYRVEGGSWHQLTFRSYASSEEAKAKCKKALDELPGASVMSFRITDHWSAIYYESLAPHGKRMRWKAIPRNQQVEHP